MDALNDNMDLDKQAASLGLQVEDYLRVDPETLSQADLLRRIRLAQMIKVHAGQDGPKPMGMAAEQIESYLTEHLISAQTDKSHAEEQPPVSGGESSPKSSSIASIISESLSQPEEHGRYIHYHILLRDYRREFLSASTLDRLVQAGKLTGSRRIGILEKTAKDFADYMKDRHHFANAAIMIAKKYDIDYRTAERFLKVYMEKMPDGFENAGGERRLKVDVVTDETLQKAMEAYPSQSAGTDYSGQATAAKKPKDSFNHDIYRMIKSIKGYSKRQSTVTSARDDKAEFSFPGLVTEQLRKEFLESFFWGLQASGLGSLRCKYIIPESSTGISISIIHENINPAEMKNAKAYLTTFRHLFDPASMYKT